jgi:hypothetical protein
MKKKMNKNIKKEMIAMHFLKYMTEKEKVKK